MSEPAPNRGLWVNYGWVDCGQCGGEGAVEDCFEDTCVCLNPPCHWATCDLCRGKGGWYSDKPEEGA